MTRLAVQRDYVYCARAVEERLKEEARRSLSEWFIGPEATTLSDIALRTAFSAVRHDVKPIQDTP